ncbi:hypothetical protein Ccrd_004017 [Cynara cardunculus var. scolymus]|uniref:Uncharacterized protein n=1 Tax=Cynara cardunculus var. scolymus TaxID=59895 RepID=A0A103XNI9_CYNCS|nr:hypothetical protein Ccrd_004017 [Cynara cardunculus var. scolymus]
MAAMAAPIIGPTQNNHCTQFNPVQQAYINMITAAPKLRAGLIPVPRREVNVLTGTWESRAFLLGSVAEKTVYTRTKVPMISAPNPVPLL